MERFFISAITIICFPIFLYAEVGDERLNRYYEAQEKAFNSIEYQEAELACSICEAMSRNAKAEQNITDELEYSEKYGTVNLSLIDKNKQAIKRNDHIISDRKIRYEKLMKRSFDPSQCSDYHFPCWEELDELRRQLMIRYGLTIEEVETYFH